MAESNRERRRQLLADQELFQGLCKIDLDALVEATHTKSLKNREELCHKGDPASQFYVIVSGELKAMATSADGADTVFSIMQAGELCGEVALFRGSRRTASMVAMGPTEVVVVDRRDFFDFLKRHPEAAIQVLAALADRLANLSDKLEDYQFLNLPNRLAKCLLSLAEKFPKEDGGDTVIDKKLSQGEIGQMVAATRESVNKQMGEWKSANVATMENGYVRILDRAELERLAGNRNLL